MGSLSPIHWLIIAFVALLIFGNRLPSIMRSLGLGVVEFKKGLQGIEDEVKGSTGKIDQPSAAPQVKDETKPAEVASGQK